jgi:hypothetical protein
VPFILFELRPSVLTESRLLPQAHVKDAASRIISNIEAGQVLVRSTDPETDLHLQIHCVLAAKQEKRGGPREPPLLCVQ